MSHLRQERATPSQGPSQGNKKTIMTVIKKLLLGVTVLLLALLAVLFVTYSSGPKPAEPMNWVFDYDLKPGNEAMAVLLDKIHTESEQLTEERRDAGLVKNLVRRVYHSPEGILRDVNYDLSEGKWEAVIQTMEKLLPRLKEGSESYSQALEFMAISYLRKGEQENCIIGHNANSCLLPIQGTGIYSLQDDTREAIKIYEELLNFNPDDWRYRWLLNVAYQTIGEYPNLVPKKWLIQNILLEDEDPTDNFLNVGPSLGLSEITRAGGAIIEDFNNDGLMDLMLSDMYRGDLKLYINGGENGFLDQTFQAGLKGQIGVFNLVQLDYNNDGYLDVLAIRGAWRSILGMHPNSLLRNNGDGTFTDVTVASGILSYKPSSSAVCADFNGDGWIDFYVGNESNPQGEIEFFSELYLNNGNGTFKEVAATSGIEVSALVKGLATADYDNDGQMDLFVSHYRGENYLFKNIGNNLDGIPQFENVTKEAAVIDPQFSFTSWFWDYNNDGNLDLFVSELKYGNGKSAAEAAKYYANVPTDKVSTGFYRNNGDGTFSNLMSEVGLDMPLNTMGANFEDINNDGWLDFYIGTGEPDYMGIHPNRLLQNRDGEYFDDVTSEKGVGHIQKGHAIAFGDFDNDGDQDILAEMGGTALGDPYQNALFQNPGNDNNWVTLKLQGSTSNRDAIGARIKLIVKNGGIRREIHRMVSSGGSFGANSLQQEIGLGQTSKIDSLLIQWPSSKALQVFTNVTVNKRYHIIQGLADLNISLFTPIIFKGIEQPMEHIH
jgi:tetratricopeptide (TPR) repeat protein